MDNRSDFLHWCLTIIFINKKLQEFEENTKIWLKPFAGEHHNFVAKMHKS